LLESLRDGKPNTTKIGLIWHFERQNSRPTSAR
jgi:hypothetical protein